MPTHECSESSPEPQETTEKKENTSSTPKSSVKRKQEGSPDTSSKRVKSAPAQPAYTKHPRFWALDGNILIQIGSTRFKLHRSRLTSQSPWFEKLFERGQGQMLEMQTGVEDHDDIADINDVRIEESDGCDLYYLDSTGTAVRDFETLLTAMDDSIDYYFKDPTFSTVAAIFRAASLLQFQKMFDFARKYLNREFSGRLSFGTRKLLPHAAEAVLLGREYGLNTVLKRAFYELAKRNTLYSTEEEYSDEEESDSDTDDVNEENFVHQLDRQDLIRIANGQKKLMSAWLSAVSLSDVNCALKTPCNSNKARITLDVMSSYLTTYQFDPICGIGYLLEVDWKKDMGYCDGCAKSRVKSLTTQREQIWENMSVWFDLE